MRRPSRVVLVVALGLSAAACTTPAAPQAEPPLGDVVANLWEWNWRSVAKECTEVLGPGGWGAVQVAPPQDSLRRAADTQAPPHPWWEVYQPVRYELTSRMGDEAAFTAMVKTCSDAGVSVIVDAVINHMTGQGNTSYGGVSYSKYDYQGLYDASDFHTFPADCDQPDGTIKDFTDYEETTGCELLGLADLKTESEEVRATVAGYLNKLIALGVAGFRVDAAKHIGPDDLAAIAAKLNQTAGGERPYLSMEVIPGGPGKLDPAAYTRLGQVWAFGTADQISSALRSGTLASLKPPPEGRPDSAVSASFVQNHDTERSGQTLSYKDGLSNLLAHQLLLASGFGRPHVYSSFAWTDADGSPPADANGMVTDTACGADWPCIHRDPGIAGMVKWHNAVGVEPVQNWFDDGGSFAAFSRGSVGFIVANAGSVAKTHEVTTGLPEGRYCDVIRAVVKDGACTGPVVEVGPDGAATVTVAPMSAVAFTTADTT